MQKPKLWTLDIAVTLLPTFDSLLASHYDSYVTTTCAAVTTVLKCLGDTILSNIKTPPSRGNVDISREERYAGWEAAAFLRAAGPPGRRAAGPLTAHHTTGFRTHFCDGVAGTKSAPSATKTSST